MFLLDRAHEKKRPPEEGVLHFTAFQVSLVTCCNRRDSFEKPLQLSTSNRML